MARELLTARLERKECISEVAQCYHFVFVIDELESFPFTAGQFVSAVAPDANGKIQTRAYSIASAPNKNQFELCVNRVEEGFFSNHLADLPDLPIGAEIQIHGPHGHFILHEPITDSILIATGTGIAPMRGYLQWLFPEDGPDRSNGKQIWLVYGTRHESDIYYQAEFEALAARHANFHYLPTLSRALDSWTGLRGYVQEHVTRIHRGARRPPRPALSRAAARSGHAGRRAELRHLRLHLRPQRDGLRRARAAHRLRLAPQADCLRALRLKSAAGEDYFVRCYTRSEEKFRMIQLRQHRAWVLIAAIAIGFALAVPADPARSFRRRGLAGDSAASLCGIHLAAQPALTAGL